MNRIADRTELWDSLMSSMQETRERPNLSALALTFFVLSFTIARIFTSISPDTVLARGGVHIHHFWFGLIMLAVGGWLGISYNDVKIDRFAAVIFGAGGGLIGDEIGLLLTLRSESYWEGITYTFVVIFVAVASILILISRYYQLVLEDFFGFLESNASLYVGISFATVSVAFIIETDNATILAASTAIAIVSCLLIAAYFVKRLKTKH
jgi:hypothetical protein